MCVVLLAHTSMVPSGDENGYLRECTPSGQQISLAPPKRTRCDPPIAQTTLPPGLSLIRQTLTGHGISRKAKDIIMASWRTGTTKLPNRRLDLRSVPLGAVHSAYKTSSSERATIPSYLSAMPSRTSQSPTPL